MLFLPPTTNARCAGCSAATLIRSAGSLPLLCAAVLFASPVDAAELKVEGDTLLLDGPIVVGDDRTFTHYLDSTTGIKRLSINSPGGDLATGLKIGHLVRARGLSTFVDADVREAASAAAYIFMGGVEREVRGGRGVGVHAFYTPRNELLRMLRQKSGDEQLDALQEFERRAQEGTMAVVEYVTLMIGDTRILHDAVKTGSAAMVWPDAASLQASKVATKLTPIDPADVPDLAWLLDEVLAELEGWLERPGPDGLDDEALALLDRYLSDEASIERLRGDLDGAMARIAPSRKAVARTRIVDPIVASLVQQLRDRPRP